MKSTAENIYEHTFRLWASEKANQPTTPDSIRKANGKRRNATELTPEQAQAKIFSTGNA